MVVFRLKLVIEGCEEETFFQVVKEKGVHPSISLDIENVGGYGEMGDGLLSALRDEGKYDLILCVYDVDNRQYEDHSPYNETRNQLFRIYGNDELVDLVSYCTNPNILQFFLLSADTLANVSLTKTSKTLNTSLVHKYWPQIGNPKKDEQGHRIKPDYDAQKWQLDIMKYSILNDEYLYSTCLLNSMALPTDYKRTIPASNLPELLNALYEGDIEYFEVIKRRIIELDN